MTETAASNKTLIIAAGTTLTLGILCVGLFIGQRAVEDGIRSNLNAQVAGGKSMIAGYRNVRVSFLRRSVSILGITLKPPGKETSVEVDKIQMSDLDFVTIGRMVMGERKPTMPGSVRLSVKGMHIGQDVMGEKASKQLQELGLDELNVSFSMGFKSDREAHSMAINDMNVELKDLGKISTSLEISHVELPTDEELANPQALALTMSARLMASSLHYAELRFVDQGLLKLVDADFKRQGKPSLSESAKFLDMFTTRQPAQTSDFVSSAVPKVKAFLQNGGSIALKAQPPTDLPFVQFANPMLLLDPEAIAKTIGLSVDAST